MTLEGGECVTVSGVACKFPFHWKGADHMGCTWVDAIGRPWCEDVNGRRANCDMDVCEGKSQEREISFFLIVQSFITHKNISIYNENVTFMKIYKTQLGIAQSL